MVLAVVAAGCSSDVSAPTSGVSFTTREKEEIARLSPLPAPPADPTNAVADDPAAAKLGQFVFFDMRFSGNGEVACVTCHKPDLGFGDGRQLAEGMGTTDRHSPTILNTVHNRWFFWDGRADSHWAQATKPMESPVEHGGSRLAFAHLVSGDGQLRQAYESIFAPLPDLSDTLRFPMEGRPVADDPSDPLHVAWSGMDSADQDSVNRIFSNLAKAIAAYERKLVRANAPFDAFAQGVAEGDDAKEASISDPAKRGLKLFVGEAGCVNCHSGPTFSDLEFHNLGLELRPWLDAGDRGRWDGATMVLEDPFNGAGVYSDDPAAEKNDHLTYLYDQNLEQLGQFKVPSLRNVSETAPYMHGGHFETLEDVLHFYSELDEIAEVVNLGTFLSHRELPAVLDTLRLSQEQVTDMVAFLESLTGEPLDPTLMVQPDSPVYP